jgi:hypothetical protein
LKSLVEISSENVIKKVISSFVYFDEVLLIFLTVGLFNIIKKIDINKNIFINFIIFYFIY